MLDEHLYTVETPEQIDVTYDIAGIGSRFLAALIDHLLFGLVLFFACLALSFFVSQVAPATDELIVLALFVIGMLLLLCVYYIFFETIWNGQTPGKRLIGLRMLRTDGRPIGFVTSTIRNIIRLIDFFPSFYGVGFLTMFIDKRSRRLGDIAAGCIAVRERTLMTLDSLASSSRTSHPVRTANQVTISNLRALHRSDYDVVSQFLQRRYSLDPQARRQLAERIAAGLQQRLGYTPEAGAEAFLEMVAAEYQALEQRTMDHGR